MAEQWPELSRHDVRTVYLDAAAGHGQVALGRLNGVGLALEDGEVDAGALIFPAVDLIAAAIDYAAERLGEDRDSIIFDLRDRIARGQGWSAAGM